MATSTTLDEGPDYKVTELSTNAGSHVTCTCTWSLKNRAVCQHIALVLREGWDAWDPVAGVPRQLPSEVAVPIFAHRQGKPRPRTKRPMALYAWVKLHKASERIHNVTVDSVQSDEPLVIGTLAIGEGRAVLREVVIDWLYTNESVIHSFNCSSPFHVKGEVDDLRAKEGIFIRDGYTILTAGVCFACQHDVGYPPDDL